MRLAWFVHLCRPWQLDSGKFLVVTVAGLPLARLVHGLRHAHSLMCQLLMQTLRHEKAETEQKLSKLVSDNDQLVQRLVESKATEVERMNEVNRTCEEMVRRMHSCSYMSVALQRSKEPLSCQDAA